MDINEIRLLIDGESHIHNVKKIIYGHNTECDLNIFQLQLNISNIEYKNSKYFEVMEFAVIDLQKQLPDNIQIICCQTCRHGNYCPFGDSENQIFCLVNYNPKNKGDVFNIISNAYETLPKSELLHWCEKYHRINDNYYTYNDWDYYFKSNNNY